MSAAGRVGDRPERVPASRRVATLLAAAGMLAMAGMLAAAAPAAARQAPACVEPGADHPETPWAQHALSPERVWPFADGAGVTVAILSTGVDAEHPQLAGRVAPGFDAVAGSGAADEDCLGAGTHAAGVLAAGPATGAGLVGLAPEVRMLPVRVVEQEGSTGSAVDPEVLAAGVRWAAENGADVVTVPIPVYSDHDALRSAVTDAVAAGVTVVAAVGELDAAADPASAAPVGTGTRAADDPSPVPYPAAYAGVIGVAATGPDGSWWPGSLPGDFVDLVAPGAGMVTLQPGGGAAAEVSGTGLASAVVAAAAALVLDRWPQSSPAEVAHRLRATANPAPAAPGVGAASGSVNAYAAVTDAVPAGHPTPLSGVDLPAGWEPAGEELPGVALIGAGAAVLFAVLVPATGAALLRGRHGSWRARTAAEPPAPPSTEPGPPLLLFDEPKR